ncbi:MAG: transaldolase family protein, partial [Streptosporangiaceae bacterium]
PVRRVLVPGAATPRCVRPAARGQERRPGGGAGQLGRRTGIQHAALGPGRRWHALEAQGASAQRPLWASTGVKNPAYPDTMYVTELIAPGTVNTMPGTTLSAFADHGEVTGNTITGRYDDARRVLDQLTAAGVDFDDVTGQLEREGLAKFADSWNELSHTVAAEMDRHHPAR